MDDTHVENREEPKQGTVEEQIEKITSEIYTTKEIEIEEVAIDGICGVY